MNHLIIEWDETMTNANRVTPCGSKTDMIAIIHQLDDEGRMNKNVIVYELNSSTYAPALLHMPKKK